MVTFLPTMMISVMTAVLPLLVSCNFMVLPLEPVKLQQQHTNEIKYYNTNPSFPLEGSIERGFYSTKVWLGNPAKEFTIFIDTGSDDLWVSCVSSSGCPTSSLTGFGEPTFFNPAGSSTASLLPCSDPQCSYCSESEQCCYDTSYYQVSSSNSGYYVKDILSFNVVLDRTSVAVNSSTTVLNFGCSTQCAGNFVSLRMDGMLGLGTGPHSFLSQITVAGVAPPIFSHCLKGEGSGGVLIFGDISDPSVAYSPLIPNQPHYTIKLTSITVGGEKVKISPKYQGVIVDSGTRFGLLAKEIFYPFMNVVSDGVSGAATGTISNDRACYHVVNSSINIFPQIRLDFDGSPMVFKPEEYLQSSGFEGDAEIWCIMFDLSPSTTIIGDFFLQEKLVVYDVLRKRIGWMNYNCSLPIHVYPVQVQSSTGSAARDPAIILRALLVYIVILLLLTSRRY